MGQLFAQLDAPAHVYTKVIRYIYIYICVCVCVCVYEMLFEQLAKLESWIWCRFLQYGFRANVLPVRDQERAARRPPAHEGPRGRGRLQRHLPGRPDTPAPAERRPADL